MKKLINKKPEDPTDAAMDAAMDKITQSALSDISSGSDVSSGSGGKSGGSNTAIYVGGALFLLVGGGLVFYFWRKNQAPVVST